MGLIAVGEETYVSSGSDWRLGPPLPGYEVRRGLVDGVSVDLRLTLAVADEVVVAITPDQAWVASLADFDAARWATAAPEPEMPTVGGTYDITLATHCGPFNGPLLFDAQSWLPDLPEGYFPLSFDYYFEDGTLDYVAADRLEFTGSKGDAITYLPTDDPPHAVPCH